MRLEGLALSRNLTESDIALLGNLTSSDAKLGGEYRELEWLLQHNFTQHVQHSLGSIYYIATQGKWVCPPDSLSHVGIFLQYNETGMAQDALNDGEQTLPEWESKALASKAKNNETYPDLGLMLSAMHAEIAAFHAGNYSGAEEQAAYLEQQGYC
jgi:hypothetical protein